MRRWILALLVVAAIGALTYYFVTTRAAAPTEVAGERIRVTAGTLEASISATGNIEASRQQPLAFRTAGRVAEILVVEGQEVRAGALIARLDTTDAEIAVAQARAAVEIQQARLRQLQNPRQDAAQEAAALSQLESARAQLERLQAGASREDLVSAQAQLSAARAALAQLRAGPSQAAIDAAEADLEQADAARRRAQAAYDQVSWRPDIGALPQSLELEQATINYQAAQARYDALFDGPSNDQVEQAQASVTQAQANLDRLLAGSDLADIAAATAGVAQAEAGVAALDLEVDANELEIARVSLRQSELSLEQAESALDAARLIAPFGGRIAGLELQVESLVTTGQPVMTLVDVNSLQVDVAVDEVDVGSIAEGDAVTVAVDAVPDETFAGRIERIATLPTVSQGVVTYLTRIVLEGDLTPLRVGMSATVEIVTERREGVALLPSRAIEIDRSTGRLFVDREVDGEIRRTEVEVGLRGDGQYEILSGVTPGDTVVIRQTESRAPIFGD